MYFLFISIHRSDSKSMAEHLEPTLEVSVSGGGGAACAVCPWDLPDQPTVETSATTATVSVSVCPWESETELPSQQQPTYER